MSGAGGSAAGSAAASGPAPASAPGFVFVKAAGARGEGTQFEVMTLLDGDNVALLAARIAQAFPEWRVRAGNIVLFLVPAADQVAVQRDTALEAAVLADVANLCLRDAPITSGSFMLARLPALPAAALGECAIRRSHPLFDPEQEA